MEIGEGFLDGAGQVDIEAAVHFGRQTGLHTDFGCAHFNRFLGASNDFLLGQEIAFFLTILPAEGAERAVLNAHIGEVDIAVDHIGHHIADLALTHCVGDKTDGVEINAIGLAQPEAVLPGYLFIF